MEVEREHQALQELNEVQTSAMKAFASDGASNKLFAIRNFIVAEIDKMKIALSETQDPELYLEGLKSCILWLKKMKDIDGVKNSFNSYLRNSGIMKHTFFKVKLSKDEQTALLKVASELCQFVWKHVEKCRDNDIKKEYMMAVSEDVEGETFTYLNDLILRRDPAIVSKLDDGICNFLAAVTASDRIFGVPINSLRYKRDSKSNVVVINTNKTTDDTVPSNDTEHLDLGGAKISCLAVSGNMLFCGGVETHSDERKKYGVFVVDTNTLVVRGTLDCSPRCLSASSDYLFAAAGRSVNLYKLEDIASFFKVEGEKFHLKSYTSHCFQDLILHVACSVEQYFAVLINGENKDGRLEVWKTDGTKPVSVLYENVNYRQAVVFDTIDKGDDEIFRDDDEEELDDVDSSRSRRVVEPHKVLFDDEKLYVAGYTKKKVVALDVWSLRNVSESTDSSVKLLQSVKPQCSIIDHLDHQYQHQAASVLLTKFSASPFVIFGEKTIKMYNSTNNKCIDQSVAVTSTHKENRSVMQCYVDQLVNLWVSGSELYMVGKDKNNESYVIRY